MITNIMRTSLVVVLATAVLPSIATESKSVPVDEFYTSLRRAMDMAEGHPPKPDTIADLDMASAVGYVAGMWDGMKLAAEMKRQGSSSCMSSPTQVAGMIRIVLRYIDTHPQAHSGDRFSAVGSAYFDAYPCLK
ncbi:Rap1a/Tai family immunity protein [Luteibacter aegosomatissinici]|uniref:Rap1a/Tai family immunity protein n=1 Tax=Luteibacter aegosomatissinici TaxID=2911539 RepID=UPI001FF7822E|nr:Rap1a/Tai family immunity protein [Luteibacter aegosomatissinici]UPG96330.1 hypothetical protein L2Y97_09540 [Luteibacter aegosomatissinici]